MHHEYMNHMISHAGTEFQGSEARLQCLLRGYYGKYAYFKSESDGEYETTMAFSLPERVLDEVRGLFFRIQDQYRFQITRHKLPQTKTKHRNGVWLAVHVQGLQNYPQI